MEKNIMYKIRSQNYCIECRKQSKPEKYLFYFLVFIAFLMFLFAVYLSRWD
jgi:hypothetical protein